MKDARAPISGVAAAVVAALLASACTYERVVVSAAAREKTGTAVQRGQYLVTIMGCNDCHTPLKMGPKGPEPDLARALSGHPEQVGALPAAKPQGP
jgi:hypothetical protein